MALPPNPGQPSLLFYLSIILIIYLAPSIPDESTAALDIDRLLLPKEEWPESFVSNATVNVKMILFSYSNKDTKDEEGRESWRPEMPLSRCYAPSLHHTSPLSRNAPQQARHNNILLLLLSLLTCCTHRNVSADAGKLSACTSWARVGRLRLPFNAPPARRRS